MSIQQKQRKLRQKSMKRSMKRIMQTLFLTLCLMMMYRVALKPTILSTSDNIEERSQYDNIKASIIKCDYTTVGSAPISGEIISDTNDVDQQIINKSIYLHSFLGNLFNNNAGIVKIFNDPQNYYIPKVNDDKKILESTNYTDKEEQTKVIKYDCSIKGYTTTNLNIRKGPSTNTEILGVLPKYTIINFDNYDEEWVVIEYNGSYAYLYKSYIIEEIYSYIDKDVYGDERKSYMDWECITSRSSKQWDLQHNYAYTESNGIRAVNGRYCIALGSYYSHDIGQYVDLILENGTVIPCIIGDAKKNIDTNINNSVGNDGSVSEFVVNTSSLSRNVRRSGDISNVTDSWNSKVVKIRIYDINIFD